MVNDPLHGERCVHGQATDDGRQKTEDRRQMLRSARYSLQSSVVSSVFRGLLPLMAPILDKCRSLKFSLKRRSRANRVFRARQYGARSGKQEPFTGMRGVGRK